MPQPYTCFASFVMKRKTQRHGVKRAIRHIHTRGRGIYNLHAHTTNHNSRLTRLDSSNQRNIHSFTQKTSLQFDTHARIGRWENMRIRGPSVERQPLPAAFTCQRLVLWLATSPIAPPVGWPPHSFRACKPVHSVHRGRHRCPCSASTHFVQAIQRLDSSDLAKASHYAFTAMRRPIRTLRVLKKAAIDDRQDFAAMLPTQTAMLTHASTHTHTEREHHRTTQTHYTAIKKG